MEDGAAEKTKQPGMGQVMNQLVDEFGVEMNLEGGEEATPTCPFPYEALQNAKAAARWTSFEQYKRPFLHPKHDLPAQILFSGDNEVASGTFRGDLFEPVKAIGRRPFAPAKLDSSLEMEKAGEHVRANRYAFEGYFWFGQNDRAQERGEEAKSCYKRTLHAVDEHENDLLTALQQQRDQLCDSLPDIDWKEALYDCYCQGLVQSALIVSEKKFSLDLVLKLLSTGELPMKPSSSGGSAAAADEANRLLVHGMARGYAFVLDSVDRGGQKINEQFVKQINGFTEKQNQGHIKREEDRLVQLLAWLNYHKAEKDIDPITLAAIAHYGIFLLQPFQDGNHRTGRLLQDFILLDSGYPPLGIFGQNINSYDELLEETRRFAGADFRPFIRFVYGCLQETIAFLQGNKQKHPPPTTTAADDTEQLDSRTGSQPFEMEQIRAENVEAMEKPSPGKAEDCSERVECKQPGISVLIKQALAHFNPALLDYAPSEPVEKDGEEGELAQKQREPAKPGWGSLFKLALGAHNPALLEYQH